jgi:serine/threonine-protein kinase
MAHLREQLAASLGAQYAIDRELGGGGMSRVFLADETALGRRVVVKVLSPEMTPGISTERFKREITVAARLQHPHIVPLLAAGETGTTDAAGARLPYFTMPYIEGESLRERLTRSGSFPIPDAVRLLREVASALTYAHDKGIVHRDIKPANILLTGQHAVVADFGVAKALAAATIVSADGLTTAGITLGTPAYMAPEQAAGDPATDHRADVYAFGAVAYEVLTGQAPFAGRAFHALIAAHMTETPAPISQKRPDVPARLSALVMQCLEKDPVARPQRAEELVRELERITITARATVDRPSVAVLPMASTSGDADNEHFSDGLTDELIGALSKVRGLAVSGRTSVFALKGKGLSTRAIADMLNVGNVLEGSVRRAGKRLKVRVQLVNADGTVLWSDAYDRTLDDVFAVQEEIAQSVVQALEVQLGTREPLVRRSTEDFIAYDLYLKGAFLRRRYRLDDLRAAIAHFEQAIARDPTFAAAYAALCDTLILHTVFAGAPSLDVAPRARAAADKAIELDPTLADARWALAHVQFALNLELAPAGRGFQRALSLDPGHVDARHMYAIYLLYFRRFAEAIVEVERTIAADPLLAAVRMTLGRVYLGMGQPERAVRPLVDALELAPAFSYARGNLGHVYLQLGRRDDAVAEFEQAVKTGGPRDVAQLAYAYGVVGRPDDAATTLRDLFAEGRYAYIPPLHVAMAHVGLGDRDEAFRWLERAYEERDPHLAGLAIIPAFHPLRSDARHDLLLDRLGLPK